MKGIIFKEFLNFVEDRTSYAMVDKIILKSGVASDGAYTTIGTYDPKEMFQLLEALSKEINMPTNQLLQQYGEYLFGKFVMRYKKFFKEKMTTFQFLSSVEMYIHPDVKKFYNDAELPHFQCEEISPKEFIMIYTSSRPLTDLAHGLIKGCINYHKENIEIICEEISVKNGAKCKFTLIKRPSK